MNWISFVTLRLFWIIQLSQGQKPETLGLDCCQRIRLSGSSIMTNFQPLAIGVYEATGGKINNRLVYKHTEVDLFAYYWNWGRRQGENWMIGDSFRNSQHRIESRNMQGRNTGWCITDINRSGFPFSVYTTNAWTRDTFLRIECIESRVVCCEKIALVGRGPARQHQSARLGIYTATASRNGRYFYTKEDGGSFIYYWDWGPNRGANWVVTNDPQNGNNRGIESPNVEYGFANNSLCLNEARKAGEFMVFNARAGVWENDRSVRVLCDPN